MLEICSRWDKDGNVSRRQVGHFSVKGGEGCFCERAIRGAHHLKSKQHNVHTNVHTFLQMKQGATA